MRRAVATVVLSLAVGLAALVAMLAAQQPTPTLERENILASTPAPVVEVVTPLASPDATIVKLPDGAPAVAIPVPPQAEPEEVRAIAETSAETQRDVASGDVPIEQATRNLDETFDPGDGGVQGTIFWLLSFFFGAYFRPAVVGRIRAKWPAGWPAITDKRERWLNAGLQLAFFAAAFYPVHAVFPSTPSTIGGWLLAAGVGVAGGSTMKGAKS